MCNVGPHTSMQKDIQSVVYRELLTSACVAKTYSLVITKMSGHRNKCGYCFMIIQLMGAVSGAEETACSCK